MAVDANDQEKLSSSSVCGYKMVPWLNWDEWEWVRDSLFSDSPDKIASAIKRISTWRSRGCLPVVIDVTASIIEIQQKDPNYSKNLPSDALHSDQMLAMLYCMAILRLVNCVVEKTRKKTEVSIAEAAGAIGIPRTLIDIRHEGSHRDLPALTLVRDSAVKAIHWLKSYYWEPQWELILSQRDGGAKIRKEIKLKLRELASCLNAGQTPEHVDSLIKGKRGKHRKQFFGCNKFFLRMAGKLYFSKSEGTKKLTTKTSKILVRLYSSFSSEVLSVLLSLLLKALNSSTLVEFPKDSQVGQDSQPSLDDWKLVITKLSNKEPELILMLLKAILNLIETQEAMKYEMGTHFSSMESSTETSKIEQLSSLFAWLVRQLKLLKPLCDKDAKAKSEVSATGMYKSNPILLELLQKCLVVSSCANKQLTESALHLAQLIGNRPSIVKLTKLSSLGISNSNDSEENYFLKCSNGLVQQDEAIHQAAKKLELVKLCLAKRRIVKATYDGLGIVGRWSVVKSWNPCPIGMLPHELGSSGRLPVLDQNDIDKKSLVSSERTQIWEDAEGPTFEIHCDNVGNKRGASYDVSLLDRSSVKKRRETVENCESDAEDFSLQTDIKGCLMINGAWKKVNEEELLAIKSDV